MSLNQNRSLVARKREREQRRVRRAGCQQRAKPSMTVDALAGTATAIRPSPATKANDFTTLAPSISTHTVYDV